MCICCATDFELNLFERSSGFCGETLAVEQARAACLGICGDDIGQAVVDASVFMKVCIASNAFAAVRLNRRSSAVSIAVREETSIVIYRCGQIEIACFIVYATKAGSGIIFGRDTSTIGIEESRTSANIETI